MRPVVDGLARTYAGRYDIKLMNTSGGDPQVARLAEEFGIQYVPTFAFVNSDGTKNGVIVGEVPGSTLEQELAKLK